MTHIVRLSDYRNRQRRVHFDRAELSTLLQLYSTRVAAGEWKDYAIDHKEGVAIFSVFRHTHDRPLYAVAKSIGPRGPDYAVFDQTRRLARSTSLSEVLEVFERKLRLVSD
ncbi:MAG: DUF2794 domain-containing protein [Alphaproteobacteria bacterium]|jgi:hypothetical protein|nr:DUF2794 domain-containing protein [Alphaproteobacteria bacterium]